MGEAAGVDLPSLNWALREVRDSPAAGLKAEARGGLGLVAGGNGRCTGPACSIFPGLFGNWSISGSSVNPGSPFFKSCMRFMNFALESFLTPLSILATLSCLSWLSPCSALSSSRGLFLSPLGLGEGSGVGD